ncbi:MAG: GDYXXLXY domain-containing protein [Candidatus Sericytochromatia bacterium]|nr:GDYXXLXY domain-containing protein [Candidatus Sericytochromatia bacterium]
MNTQALWQLPWQRLRLLGLVALALLQLAVPVSMIQARENVLQQGKAFRIQTLPVDPYDLFRGRYVALNPENPLCPHPGTEIKQGQWAYASLETAPDGFVRCSALSLQPPQDRTGYLRLRVTSTRQTEVSLDWPFDRFYLEEPLAPAAEDAYRQMSAEDKAWIEVRVYKGRGVLAQLYLNEMPLRDYLLQLPAAQPVAD